MDWSKIVMNFFAYSAVRFLSGVAIALVCAVVLTICPFLIGKRKAKK